MTHPTVLHTLARDPRGSFWYGLSWSTWAPFAESNPRRHQGIYRVRSSRTGLAYIGMSGNLASRIGTLRRSIEAGGGHVHPAGACIKRSSSGRIEVSWVELTESRREVYGIEVDLIAAYRAEVGESPHCQWSERQRRQGGLA
jgi:hypothetical protein